MLIYKKIGFIGKNEIAVGKNSFPRKFSKNHRLADGFLKRFSNTAYIAKKSNQNGSMSLYVTKSKERLRKS